MKLALFAIVCLSLAGFANAQAEMAETPPPVEGASAQVHEAAQVEPPYNHPTLPAEAVWAGATVVLILGSFLMAAGVGVSVDLTAPEGVPAAHAHDEPHGAAHH